MNPTLRHRFLRLSIGLLGFAIPLAALISVQVTPSAAYVPPPSPQSQENRSLSQINTISETETAIAATQTVIAATQTAAASATSVAQTLTAFPATQTAVAGTQTAIAATQTAAARPTGTAQFGDIYEPNNTLQTAYTVAAGAVTSQITLWPIGDLDYFRFYAKAGSAYQIFTRDLASDLDTILRAYNTQGSEIASNDDYRFGFRDSQVTIQTPIDGYYFVRVENKAPTDPINKTYGLEIKEVQPPTATPTRTPIPSNDPCDTNGNNNFSFDTACLLIADAAADTYDFVPVNRDNQDNDYFRMWVRQGFFYTCLTDDLGPFNDTNMIIYDQNRQGLAGNNDRDPAAGDIRSEITYYAAYTGWLYILIGPVYPPEYSLAGQYTYSLACTSAFVTPTLQPTRTPTLRPTAAGGGGGFVPPAATATPTPTLTPAALPTFPLPITEPPTPRPIIVITPLPTSTTAAPPQQTLSVNVTIYYDENLNFLPELTEGIMDVAVALYDNGTGQLLALGSTNEAGSIHFGPLAVAGAVRLEIPFLGYTQVIVSSEPDIQLRVAPTNLPGLIP